MLLCFNIREGDNVFSKKIFFIILIVLTFIVISISLMFNSHNQNYVNITINKRTFNDDDTVYLKLQNMNYGRLVMVKPITLQVYSRIGWEDVLQNTSIEFGDYAGRGEISDFAMLPISLN